MPVSRSRYEGAIAARDRALLRAEKAEEKVRAWKVTATTLTRQLEAAEKLAISAKGSVEDADTALTAELRDLRQQLALAKEAQRSLGDQVETLRRANDDLSRQAVDRAGTLTTPAGDTTTA